MTRSDRWARSIDAEKRGKPGRQADRPGIGQRFAIHQAWSFVVGALHQIVFAIEGNDSGHAIFGVVLGADKRNQMSAGGFAHQHEALRIHFVLRRVNLDEMHGAFDVIGLRRERMLGREAVIYREPRVALFDQRIEQRLRIGCFVAGYEASAMHPDDSRKWAGAFRYECV